MCKIPAFKRSIVGITLPLLQPDSHLVTKEIENESGLRCLVPVLEPEKYDSLNGLTYKDFQIQELTEAGKIDNLRPAAPISLSPLAAYDKLEQCSTVLIDKMDLDIFSHSTPEPTPEPTLEPAPEPAK